MYIKHADEYSTTTHWKSAETCGQVDKGLTATSERHASMATATNKGSILIVDDNEHVRETLAELLEIVGYHPLQAADAREALVILRQDATIDALVTDMTMPGTDGIVLIQLARELRPNLAAILLTGYAEQIASGALTAPHSFEILSKPVESQHLLEQIELLVQRSRHA